MTERRIPYEDWGGAGPCLHFAHANAYPPGAYRVFLESLARRYHLITAHHRPLWPGSQPEGLADWSIFAEDLLVFLNQQHVEQLIGVGHSLGAVATLMAAVRQPGLFSCLVLIEPVFLLPDILAHFSDQAAFDPEDLPLVQIARNRRNSWSSRAEAFAYLRPKRVFARWPDRCLWDYVEAGLRKNEGGYFELRFDPAWEAWIYGHIPTNIWSIIPQLTVPTLAVRGSESDTLVSAAWELWQTKQPEAFFVEMAGAGHLLPMEKPIELANLIAQFVAGLG